MKPYIIKLIAACSLMLYACQSVDKKPTVINQMSTSENIPDVKNEMVANSKALNENPLMAKSDCYSCHTNDTKLVGPSFKDIAHKYSTTPDDINLLVDKIINGGSGVWGQVPMQSHSQLSEVEAKEMVNFILALK